MRPSTPDSWNDPLPRGKCGAGLELDQGRHLRKRVTCLALLLVGLAAFTLWLRSPADPLYKGKRLSAYLYETRLVPLIRIKPPNGYNPGQRSNRSEADDAVRALGPRAVPLMIDWLQADVVIRQKLKSAASQPGSHFKWLLQWDWVMSDPRSLAFDALSRLIPEHGAPAVPVLRKQILQGESSVSLEAADLLIQILKALPAEETCSRAEQNAHFIEVATRAPPKRLTRGALRMIGALIDYGVPYDAEGIVRRLWPYRYEPFSNARNAIALVDADGFYRYLIYLESGTPGERDVAALFFKNTPRAPERIVPLLISNLVETGSISLLQDASSALGAYGTNAVSALPQIRSLLIHPQTGVVGAASNAIARIAI